MRPTYKMRYVYSHLSTLTSADPMAGAGFTVTTTSTWMVIHEFYFVLLKLRLLIIRRDSGVLVATSIDQVNNPSKLGPEQMVALVPRRHACVAPGQPEALPIGKFQLTRYVLRSYTVKVFMKHEGTSDQSSRYTDIVAQ